MPRKYSMEARSTAVQETRQRIIDATVQLHNEQGVSGTSMQDIADRAGVALATVYRHFPSMDDLVPACGGRNLELNPPPSADVFDGLETGEERITALIDALYAHYERGVRPYEVGFAEAPTIPAMARLMDELGSYLESTVASAIAPWNPDRRQTALAVGLIDFRTWRALTAAGLTTAEASEMTAQLITSAMTSSSAMKGR